MNHPIPSADHAPWGLPAPSSAAGWANGVCSAPIDNRHPNGFSGRVIGQASFVASSGDACRYREDGLLHRVGVSPLRVHRDYVYVYDRSKDRLSVHFAAGADRGSLMCHLRVLPPEDEAHALQPGPMPTRSWRLQGEHPCNADIYRVMHHVTLADTVVQAMEVVHEVSGPTKGYTSWAEYTRPAAAKGRSVVECWPCVAYAGPEWRRPVAA